MKHIADVEKILVTWIKDKTRHNITINQCPTQSQVPKSLQFFKGSEWEGSCKRKA